MSVRKRNFHVDPGRGGVGTLPRWHRSRLLRRQRVDPWLGTVTHVVASRQDRPNLPSADCPFCPGGIEAAAADAPERGAWAFANRWPAMPDGRCEIVVYDSDHTRSLCELGVDELRGVVDLWAQRTEALGARPDVAYVLVFENRGEEVGATIAHPHGQIYAYDHVPARPAALLAAGWRPDPAPGDRLVSDVDGWRAWVPFAPVHPVSVTLAPSHQVPDLVALGTNGRDSMASALSDVLRRLDALFGRPLPLMMWINQRPTGAAPTEWPGAWVNVEIVSPWRAAALPRFIAAAELGGGGGARPRRARAPRRAAPGRGLSHGRAAPSPPGRQGAST